MVLGSSSPTLQLPCPCRAKICRRSQKLRAHTENIRAASEERTGPQQRPIKPGVYKSSVLSLAPILQVPNKVSRNRIAKFRFWHDEKRFRGTGDTSLAQHVLLAAGGTRMGGNFKNTLVQGPMGWQQPHRWDILWSTSDGNLKAAHCVRPGQLLSGLPGMDCLTKKRHLAVTLQTAYGDAAWQMLPKTYSIPAQLLEWRQCLSDDASAAESALSPAVPNSAQTFAECCADRGSNSGAFSSGYWVLKTGAHLGQGLKIVPANKALSTLLERNKPYLSPPGQLQPLSSSSSNSSPANRLPAGNPRAFICVQQYITNPLLINGRKFGIRLWVLVIGPAPFRTYLYSNGLVLFSGQQYNSDMQQMDAGGPEVQGHLTNHAQDQSADVWALQQLFDLLGPQPSARLWEQLTRTAGRVVAAAASHVRAAAQELKLPEECAFELLGLDFLLDGSLKPWLLEVNASPSMAWHHTNEQTAKLMKQVKQELLSDLLCLLRLQDRYPAAGKDQRQHQKVGSEAATQQQQQQQRAEQSYWPPGIFEKEQADVAAPRQASSSTPRSGQDSSQLPPELNVDTNQIMLQAASAKYFGERPQVQLLVQEAAELLHAAVEAAPLQHQAQQQVQHLLSTLQQQPANGQAHPTATEPGRSNAGVVAGSTALRQDVFQLLQDHADKLAQLEAEFQSPGRWQSLLDSIPAVITDEQQSGIDAAMRLYWQLRTR